MIRIFLLSWCLLCLGLKAELMEGHKLLELSPYKKYVAGKLSLPMKVTRHDEFHLGLSVAPSFGIFVANNLEQRLQFSLTAQHVFSKAESLVKTPYLWDISWATIYYFSWPERLFFYVGGGLGVGFLDFNLYTINILLDAPLGLLVPLSENCALDVGVPLRVRISPRAFFDSVEFPLGVVGIRYFF